MSLRWSLLALIVIGAIWASASVIAMTYGTLLNWPDFVHKDFGIPLTFATHTLSTIAGPVDNWDVNLGALAGDLLFWSIGLALIVLAFYGYSQSRVRTQLTH